MTRTNWKLLAALLVGLAVPAGCSDDSSDDADADSAADADADGDTDTDADTDADTDVDADGDADGDGDADADVDADADADADTDADVDADTDADADADSDEDRWHPDAWPDGDVEPNPSLADLDDNTAVDLGPTDLEGAADEIYSADAVTDYSGFVYSMDYHRLLMFGGGHATTYSDTIYVFDFGSLAWDALYPPTPAANMVCSNFSNDLGGWLSGPEGPYPRPAARHTYDMLVAPTGHAEFLVLRMGDGGNEQVDTCEYYWGGTSYARYDIEGGAWEFLSDPTWTGGFGSEAAEYDPVSDKVVMLGGAGLFLYDPGTRTASTAMTGDDLGWVDLGYANHLVYYPPNQRMYYFNRNSGTVWELTLDRADFGASSVVELETTGPYPPHGEPGFDFDWVSQIIGGAVHENRFYAFDPETLAWSVEDIRGGSPGSQSFHALAYDPVDNVFVFVTDDRHTWAYRYRR
jgi:hypothetical protein